MYCVKCGVHLADTEKVCPLCGTRVCHPDVKQPDTQPLYPRTTEAAKTIKRWSIMLILSILFLLPISICLVSDLAVNGHAEWSGFVIGALVVFYAMVMLPSWFEHPNPVIFVPVFFATVAIFLQYVCFATDGNWYWTFALPMTGAVCVICTAVVTLWLYIVRGRLYIIGGAVIATGAFCLLLEFLLTITFTMPPLFTWSLYPLTVLTVLGMAILATAIFRPLRESLEKKLFL